MRRRLSTQTASMQAFGPGKKLTRRATAQTQVEMTTAPKNARHGLPMIR